MTAPSGRLAGIAVRPARRAPVVELQAAEIAVGAGLAGDHAGKRPLRLVTIIERESWVEACAALSPAADPVGGLPWTVRRANLLTEGVRLPRAAGGVVRVGRAVLEITGQTYPCSRMEEARPGLLKALASDWRGGVLCAVIEGGGVAIGDEVEILKAPPERPRPYLP